MKMRIADIVIGNRHRKDPGDIEDLATDIKKLGLLQPVCVTPQKTLVDGWRRMLAAQHLGWETIECYIHDLEQIVAGEFSATVHRKNYLISELAAIYLEVKPMLDELARQRKVEGGRRGGKAKHRGNSPKPENRSDRMARGRKKMGARTRDLIERYSGGLWSGQMIERAAAICQAAREDPKQFGHLQEEMDAGTQSLSSAWHKFNAIGELKAIPAQPAPKPGKYENEILQGNCLEWLKRFERHTFDGCHADPLFGVGYLYGNLVEPINRDPVAYWKWLQPIYQEIVRVVKPGGLIAIHQSLFYMRYFWEWFGPDIEIFSCAKSYVPIIATSELTWAWHPVVMAHKPGGKKLCPKRKIDTKNHFTSTVQCDAVARLHPCPLPPDLCEYFMSAYYVEGGWILDPFCGSGSIGLSCLATGRRHTGIEERLEYVELARKRLAMAGRKN